MFTGIKRGVIDVFVSGPDYRGVDLGLSLRARVRFMSGFNSKGCFAYPRAIYFLTVVTGLQREVRALIFFSVVDGTSKPGRFAKSTMVFSLAPLTGYSS